mgnify:CR=1 FL=1
MKRKCICLFLWLLVIALSYGGGYLCFAWPLSEVRTDEMPEVLPVTAGKENFILPETRLVTETLNLKTGEKVMDESPMPANFENTANGISLKMFQLKDRSAIKRTGKRTCQL